MQHQLGVEQQRARIQIEAAEQRLLLPHQDQLGVQTERLPSSSDSAMPCRISQGR